MTMLIKSPRKGQCPKYYKSLTALSTQKAAA